MKTLKHLASQKLLLNFTVSNSQKDLRINRRSVLQACEELVPSSFTEFHVHFVTQQRICKLHQEFFNDPSPTDCISFPSESPCLGEVVICPKAAIDYAPDSFYEELTLYLVHGILHCLGYDDIEKKDRSKMRKMEKKFMSILKNKNKLISS